MAHEFDGASGNINYGSASALDDLALAAFSIHVWYNADTVGEGNTGRVASKRPSGGGGGWLFFSDATASLGFQSIDSGGGVEAQQRGADNACTLNAWHSVALTYDNDGDRKGHIYVDGSEISYDTDAAAGASQNATDANGDFYVGQASGADTRTFDGEEAEFSVWTRVITAAEITQLSKGFTAGFFPASLVLYAPLIRSAVDTVLNVGTATNTTVTDHPTPLYYPSRPFLIDPTAASVHTAAVFGDHSSDIPLKADSASGAPNHIAGKGTLYWDTTNDKLYVNNSGAGGASGWTALN